MSSLNMSNSSHHRCFICNIQNVRLHQITDASIIYAFVHFNIFIKQGTRCCGRHLDNNMNLRKDEYNNISSRQIPIEKYVFKMLYLLKEKCKNDYNKCCIFDGFKNIDNLDDRFIFKITRWNKLQFVTFSSYITSINNTTGRTKNELIAIYRFWLFKGIDQTSLAMFKTDTDQQQISRYLEQIRIAIERDFVPFFLGVKSRSREFFVGHNTLASKTIYGLNDSTLCIVADGTYIFCVKSSNNSFQYKSFSMQKDSHLIKPFLIICPDGYIIDSYGPFPANKNDSSIFNSIINTDNDLRDLMIPFQTVVIVDRGLI